MCGTDTLRKEKDASLGERFLDVDCLDHDADTHPYLERAASNAYKSITANFNGKPTTTTNDSGTKESNETIQSPMLNLKATTAGYIIYLKESLPNISAPTISDSTLTTIIKLAKFLSYLRADIPSGKKNDDPTYKPRVELATRLSGQFTKLCMCASIVLNKPNVDSEVLDIARKVVCDSSLHYNYLTVEAIKTGGTTGLSCSQIAHEIGLSESQVRRKVLIMHRLGILTRRSVPNNSGTKGRDIHLWKLSKQMIPLAKAQMKL